MTWWAWCCWWWNVPAFNLASQFWQHLLVFFLVLFSFSLLCASLLCSSSASLSYSNKIIREGEKYTHYLHHQSPRTDGTNGIKGSDAPFSTQHHFDFPLGSPFLQHLAFIDGTLAPNSCWGEEKEREGPDRETPKYVSFVKTGDACKWMIHSTWNTHEDLQLTAAAFQQSASVAPLLLADVTTVQMSVAVAFVLLPISISWFCRCLFLPLRPRCPSFLSSYNLSSVPSLITPVNYTVFPQTKWIWSVMTSHYLPQKIRGGGNQLSVPPTAASPSFSTSDSCDITGSTYTYIMQPGYKYSHSCLPCLFTVGCNASWRGLVMTTWGWSSILIHSANILRHRGSLCNVLCTHYILCRNPLRLTNKHSEHTNCVCVCVCSLHHHRCVSQWSVKETPVISVLQSPCYRRHRPIDLSVILYMALTSSLWVYCTHTQMHEPVCW